ncbi:MAG: hypothetical protein SXQ77_03950 [Halobacteria archaeon]|nr:hypothetical protein [Halobacteria archaeon]
MIEEGAPLVPNIGSCEATQEPIECDDGQIQEDIDAWRAEAPFVPLAVAKSSGVSVKGKRTMRNTD